MDLKVLYAKIENYELQITKLGNLTLLSEAIEAQEKAVIATKEARLLYKKYRESC